MKRYVGYGLLILGVMLASRNAEASACGANVAGLYDVGVTQSWTLRRIWAEAGEEIDEDEYASEQAARSAVGRFEIRGAFGLRVGFVNLGPPLPITICLTKEAGETFEEAMERYYDEIEAQNDLDSITNTYANQFVGGYFGTLRIVEVWSFRLEIYDDGSSGVVGRLVDLIVYYEDFPPGFYDSPYNSM